MYMDQSLPSWERGLKLTTNGETINVGDVAPLVGAWIEIHLLEYNHIALSVAPLVGAWIEIRKSDIFLPMSESLPSWERGLKS